MPRLSEGSGLLRRFLLGGLFVLFGCLLNSVSAQDVCVNGFIMDTYCADRGTLLDNPTVQSLINPEKHTLHCLVDVSRCINGGFEVLEAPLEGSDTYCRVFKLDSRGNELVLALARQTGSRSLGCTTCGTTGALREGFKCSVVGTPEGSDAPRTLNVKSVHIESCDDVIAQNSGVTNAVITDDMRFCETNDGWIIAHGALMLASWGFLLPLGIAMAISGRKRDPLWFKLHVGLQVTGLILAIAGWATALVQSQVLDSGGGILLTHAAMGCVVMGLGILQPVNALFRPHKPQPGERKSLGRLVWELAHKILGNAALGLALATIVLGALQTQYFVEFLSALGAALFVVIVSGVLMWCTSPKTTSSEETHESVSFKGKGGSVEKGVENENNNPSAAAFGRSTEQRKGNGQAAAVVSVEAEHQRVLASEEGREERAESEEVSRVEEEGEGRRNWSG
uniref:Cytochrome b561 domain-containing protein n=1 Tax=Chromera velia CCMP2878 TaxID=1169474 RepID=A0A0G4I6R2_9ALVE|mmetsp:Transcript_18608/g.37661  ORF Transcript_18608/g.37661 Transcript_18608/m.37661 type:complete len:452 (-) Transcript_18608:731-2086(-)|eukprot:Cvel_11399.t1-p1 / transcript=Cvel_11399.t1 / gene=Cvel_11399 / organism=Chromera_velia_CCMP2878 / gene_product=hypothetical protein / transcript_product=hypothetical protein / location=Cvel_scaffold715:49306-50658(+) / protein_length=451 / sequence_SO=supercontig / SO=protein_coding / is_pseudo=false